MFQPARWAGQGRFKTRACFFLFSSAFVQIRLGPTVFCSSSSRLLAVPRSMCPRAAVPVATVPVPLPTIVSAGLPSTTNPVTSHYTSTTETGWIRSTGSGSDGATSIAVVSSPYTPTVTLPDPGPSRAWSHADLTVTTTASTTTSAAAPAATNADNTIATSQSPAMSTAAISGIVIGSVLSAAAIIFFWWYCRRRRRSHRKHGIVGQGAYGRAELHGESLAPPKVAQVYYYEMDGDL
ncbi:hypothetical protein B0T19DRAFT_417847 [Cercophora scortea]|uniref:Uncharacterized protein n=1 Tax=Cercophora scortea TaxID=314031 RepID=A0AAE0IXZ5_9PEZI|nr:hypothetical protein B0T19DRAFT_417847 [Cercophora scortea]